MQQRYHPACARKVKIKRSTEINKERTMRDRKLCGCGKQICRTSAQCVQCANLNRSSYAKKEDSDKKDYAAQRIGKRIAAGTATPDDIIAIDRHDDACADVRKSKQAMAAERILSMAGMTRNMVLSTARDRGALVVRRLGESKEQFEQRAKQTRDRNVT